MERPAGRGLAFLFLQRARVKLVSSQEHRHDGSPVDRLGALDGERVGVWSVGIPCAIIAILTYSLLLVTLSSLGKGRVFCRSGLPATFGVRQFQVVRKAGKSRWVGGWVSE